MRVRLLLAALSALLVVVPAAEAQNRYELVHGCYTLTTGDGKAVDAPGQPFRMQATRLGEYLFFGKGKVFLAADGSGVVASAAEPSANANWRVEERAGGGFQIQLPSQERWLTVGEGGKLTLDRSGSGFRFVKADGCATYPEAELNVNGK